uniref:Opsin n=3 Tax=Heliconius TaxID=33416 RepID=E2DZL8_HELME|nr:ultraviolet-sensitive visual pigment [Heliconius melpomene rosina]ADN96770.1 ultraviolet-sensitive visual pigment [Heliconius elevatus]ADN96771.1 ultraviolet-sensitive visual pigment [Heliconius melpomene]ART30036.1 opsin [Heliconius melpomene]ART30040.1 opsin [Heliconius melpomene]
MENETQNHNVYGAYFAPLRSSDGVKMLVDGLSSAELEFIPEHWLSYPAPPASAHTALALMYCFFTAAALIGNGLVIYIFATTKSLRTSSNLLILNLAVFDFIMMAKAPIFIYNSAMRGFAIGSLGCQIFALVGSYSGIGAAMTNLCIAYDRHSTITRPLDGRLSRGKALLLIACVWIYTTPWSLLPLFRIWGRFVPEGYLTACSFDYLTNTFDTKLFTGCIFIFAYAIPLCLIMYYYSGIVKQVFAHEAALREQAKKMNVESLRSNHNAAAESAEIRIAKAALTVCFLYVASWTPYGVMSLIGAFGDQQLLSPGVTMIPAIACKGVACIDPWVYAISHPKYRQELQRRMPWLQIREPDDNVSTGTNNTTNSAAPAATA